MTKFYRAKIWSLTSINMNLTLYFQWPLKLTYSTREKIKSLYCIITRIWYTNNLGKRFKTDRKTNQIVYKQCISGFRFQKKIVFLPKLDLKSWKNYSAEIWIKIFFFKNGSKLLNYPGNNNPESNPPPPHSAFMLHVFQSFSINHIPQVTNQIHSDEPAK